MAEKKKPSTKSSAKAPVDVPTYKPNLYVDGPQAQRMQKMQVGKKVKLVVEGTITGQSISRDYMDASKKNHNVNIEIDKVRPQAQKRKPKP